MVPSPCSTRTTFALLRNDSSAPPVSFCDTAWNTMPARAARIGVPSGIGTSIASRLAGVLCVMTGPPGAWPMTKVRPSSQGTRYIAAGSWPAVYEP